MAIAGVADRPRRPWLSISYGTLTVAGLDALDAILFFGARGVSPTRIFQSIASGLLGRRAFSGGLPVAALGILLHVLVAFGIMGTYYLLSRRFRRLRSQPWLWGPIHGLAAWTVMNFVVVPLSLVTRAPFTWPVVLNGLLIHGLGVGPASAWFSREKEAPRSA